MVNVKIYHREEKDWADLQDQLFGKGGATGHYYHPWKLLGRWQSKSTHSHDLCISEAPVLSKHEMRHIFAFLLFSLNTSTNLSKEWLILTLQTLYTSTNLNKEWLILTLHRNDSNKVTIFKVQSAIKWILNYILSFNDFHLIYY